MFFWVFKGASSQWSAYRVWAEDEGKFDAIMAAKEGHPVFFTGEVGISYILCFKNNKHPLIAVCLAYKKQDFLGYNKMAMLIYIFLSAHACFFDLDVSLGNVYFHLQTFSLPFSPSSLWRMRPLSAFSLCNALF